MREVVIAGVGMTRFAKSPERTFSSLVTEATGSALADAGASPGDVEFIYYANSSAGVIHGQEAIRGQHAVRGSGLEGIPLVNVENACASGSTAVNQAWLAVASGQVDVAVAVGAEKLIHEDRSLAFKAMAAALDQDRLAEIEADLGTSGTGSIFMDIYARFAQWYADRTDATPADFAQIAVKNHAHGALNPKAQYGAILTVEEVLSSRKISGDLTLLMCAPMSDGAAAAVITTPEIAARWGADPVTVLATVLGAGRAGIYGEVVPDAARRAYEIAGVGPSDIDVIECHDAASPAELIVTEELGLCEPGGATGLLRSGATTLGGRIPFNPSGGLWEQRAPRRRNRNRTARGTRRPAARSLRRPSGRRGEGRVGGERRWICRPRRGGRIHHHSGCVKNPNQLDIDQQLFRHVLGNHPSGVVVVTTLDDAAAPIGMTVDSFVSASLDPPMTMFLAGKGSATLASIRRSGHFCANVLAHDQESLARGFAVHGVDKFQEVAWAPSEATGAPLLAETVAWVDCIVEHLYEAGDHVIVLGRVIALDAAPGRDPLVFFRGRIVGLSL